MSNVHNEWGLLFRFNNMDVLPRFKDELTRSPHLTLVPGESTQIAGWARAFFSSVAFPLVLVFFRLAWDLLARVIPFHDGAQIFSAFYHFYSSLLMDGQIPLWSPQTVFGQPSSVFMIFVTPVGYFVGLVGKLLGMQNTLALAKVVLLGEASLFAVSTHLLAKLLFRRLESRVLVTLAAVLGLSWIWSMDGAFHDYYCLPLIMYFLCEFLGKKDFRCLGWSALAVAFSLVGNTPYYLPKILMTVLLVGLPLLFAGKIPRWKSLTHKASGSVYLLLGVAFAVSYVACLRFGYDGLIPLIGKRNLDGTVTLKEFLTYVGTLSPARAAGEFVRGQLAFGDTAFYFGLAPLLLFIYGAFQAARSSLVRTFLFAVVALTLFASGGLTSIAAYYAVPGMKYYRHIALVFGIVRFLMLLIAGFGLDQLMDRRTTAKTENFNLAEKIFYSLAAVFFVADLGTAFFATRPEYVIETMSESAFDNLWLRVLVLSTIFAVMFVIARRRKALAFILALSVTTVADLSWFRFREMAQMPSFDDHQWGVIQEIYRAKRPIFRLQRASDPTRSEEGDLLSFRGNIEYPNLAALLNTPTCHRNGRVDFLPEKLLLSLAGQDAYVTLDSLFSVVSGSDFAKGYLGCDRPKLQLLLPDVEGSGVRSVAGSSWRARVDFFSYNSAEFAVQSDLSHPAVFYYSDAWMPGWSAWVNGEPKPVGNVFGLKGVEVPPGESRIVLRYAPPVQKVLYYVVAVFSLLVLSFFTGYYFLKAER